MQVRVYKPLMSGILSVAVDIALSQFEKVNSNFAHQTGIPPFLGFWALPGGLIRTDLGELGEIPKQRLEVTGGNWSLGVLDT